MVKEIQSLKIIQIEEEYAEKEWDDIIGYFRWNNLYQSYRWGEFKRDSGWTPLRLTISKDGKLVSAVQLLKKTGYGCMAAWSPGGPLFYKDADIIKIFSLIKDYCSRFCIPVYLRLYPMVPESETGRFILSDTGWSPPLKTFHKSLTIMADLSEDMDKIRMKLKQKWRYYLKKSETYKHDFKICSEEKELCLFADAYNGMCKRKGTDEMLDVADLIRMKKRFTDSLLLFLTFKDNILTSGWLMARHNDKAYVLRAATTKEGRDLFASYYCIWKAFEYLREKRCKGVDMGGIDPANNPGVTHFKRGVGGMEIKWLGEWEYANLPFVKKVVNRYFI